MHSRKLDNLFSSLVGCIFKIMAHRKLKQLMAQEFEPIAGTANITFLMVAIYPLAFCIHVYDFSMFKRYFWPIGE